MSKSKQIIFHLCLLASITSFASEFDTKSAYKEIRELHNNRMQAIAKATQNFLAAKGHMERVFVLDKEACALGKKCNEISASYDKAVKEKTKECTEKHDAIYKKMQRISTQLDKSQTTLDSLHKKRSQLKAEEASYSAGAFLDEVRKEIQEIDFKISKQVEVRNSYRADSDRSLSESKILREDCDKWLDNHKATGSREFATISRNLEENDKSIMASTQGFLEDYRHGFYGLLEYWDYSEDIEAVASKFLSAIEGFGDLLCFIEGTLVETPDGPMPIEKIKVGQEVNACNEEKTLCTVQTVKKVRENSATFFVNLEILGESIVVTPNHPIFAKNRGWVIAEQVEQGDEVLTVEKDEFDKKVLGSAFIDKKSFKSLPQPVRVFNLELDKDHTYFAGSSNEDSKRIVVHNCNIKKTIGDLKPLESAYGVLMLATPLTIKTCRISLNVGPLALVGGPVTEAVEISAVLISCSAALALTAAATAGGVEFVKNLSIMESRLTEGPRISKGHAGKKMLGADGTQVTSKTVWKGQGKERIDVENPNPGQRPGQIHYQDNAGNKYLYNPEIGSFVDAPKKVNDLLGNLEFRDGIKKAMKYLGEQ